MSELYKFKTSMGRCGVTVSLTSPTDSTVRRQLLPLSTVIVMSFNTMYLLTLLTANERSSRLHFHSKLEVEISSKKQIIIAIADVCKKNLCCATVDATSGEIVATGFARISFFYWGGRGVGVLRGPSNGKINERHIFPTCIFFVCLFFQPDTLKTSVPPDRLCLRKHFH